MKITYQALSCAALLLTPSFVSGQTYGGFPVNKTFTLKVISKTTESYNGLAGNPGGNLMTNIPVPSGIIDLSIGQNVTFKIGTKGALLFAGTQYGHAFQGGGNYLNSYGKNQSSGPYPMFTGYSDYFGNSVIYKSSYGLPISGQSTFWKYTPYGNLTQVVTYKFK